MNWKEKYDNPKVGDKVIITKLSNCTHVFLPCNGCNFFLNKIGTLRYINGDKYTVDNFEGCSRYCSSFDYNKIKKVVE